MNRIKELRLEKKLSQQQLASEIGVHQTAVSQWENGTTSPEFAALCALCSFFDVSFEYLTEHSNTRQTFSSNHFDDDPPTQENATPAARIETAFDKLNDAGQQKAVERVEELTEIPKYKKDPDE